MQIPQTEQKALFRSRQISLKFGCDCCGTPISGMLYKGEGGKGDFCSNDCMESGADENPIQLLKDYILAGPGNGKGAGSNMTAAKQTAASSKKTSKASAKKAKEVKLSKESTPETKFGFRLIDPDLIDAKPAANLRHYGSSEEAIRHKMSTVKKVGQLQPVRVYAVDGGRFKAIFGSQRVKAAQLLKKESDKKVLQTIKVEVVKEVDPKKAFEAAVVENAAHDSMSAMDCAFALEKGIAVHKMTRGQVGALFGKGAAWVSQTLSLLTLTPEMQEKVHSGELGAYTAYQYAKMPPETRDALGEKAGALTETKMTGNTLRALEREVKEEQAETEQKAEAVAASPAEKKDTAAAKKESAKQRTNSEVRSFLTDLVDENMEFLSDHATDWLKFFNGKVTQSTMRRKILEFGNIEVEK